MSNDKTIDQIAWAKNFCQDCGDHLSIKEMNKGTGLCNKCLKKFLKPQKKKDNKSNLERGSDTQLQGGQE